MDVLAIVPPAAYVAARITGNLTEAGLHLSGGSALLWATVLVGCFVVGKRLGGTIWERILKTHSQRR